MRLGVELLGVQSEFGRGRGIGRYCRHLIKSLARNAGPGDEVMLFVHRGLPEDDLVGLPSDSVHRIGSDPARALDGLVRANPHDLDVLLLTSPASPELCGLLPARGPGSPRLASIVYDLIPLRYPDRYLASGAMQRIYHRMARRLGRFDRLLTISESAKQDVLDLLAVPSERVSTISAASDPGTFGPDPVPGEEAILARLGVAPPFLFCLGGQDERKNLAGLIDGFAALPHSWRSSHHLVITCFLTRDAADSLRRRARNAGVGDRLVLTGSTDDIALGVLYRRCAAFLFPSEYEGFGLPLLEAMHCGACVVSAETSSLPEVVGDAGLYFRPHCPNDLAHAVARVLDDPRLAIRLRQSALERASTFTWDGVAARAWDALRLHVNKTVRIPSSKKTRIAVFTPLPPVSSGVADHAACLLGHLAEHYDIDVYHDTDRSPSEAARPEGLRCLDHRLFDRLARARPYATVLHQMGNSEFHGFIHDRLRRTPGLVTLHDASLVGFHAWRDETSEPGHLQRVYESERSHDPHLPPWDDVRSDPRTILVEREAFLNRDVFIASCLVLVHSRWTLDRAPHDSAEVRQIPLGSDPLPRRMERREAARARIGLSSSTVVCLSTGIVAGPKMNVEAIAAVSVLVREGRDVALVLAGEERDGGLARRAARDHRVGDRVIFLGRYREDELPELGAIADLGLALRRPPTRGETSAALLDLLRMGLPTVVINAGSFAEFPDEVVEKVAWDEVHGHERLTAVLRCLVDQPARRASLGSNALAHIMTHHAWTRVVDSYRDAIERTIRLGRIRGIAG